MVYSRQRAMSLTLQKKAWVTTGFIFVGLGILGLILPLMPGLVFFILASFCFAKGSRKFLRMLIAHKLIGPQIMDWKRGKGMYLQTKITAAVTVILSMWVSAVYLVKVEWVRYCIAICALIAVSVIFSVKTKK